MNADQNILQNYLSVCLDWGMFRGNVMF